MEVGVSIPDTVINKLLKWSTQSNVAVRLRTVDFTQTLKRKTTVGVGVTPKALIDHGYLDKYPPVDKIYTDKYPKHELLT